MITASDPSEIPDAIPGETIVVTRPKRALARLFAEPPLRWRASVCGELLARGWRSIRVRGETAFARG